MPRLKSTKDIFRNKIQTTLTLLNTTIKRLEADELRLTKFRTSLVHTKRRVTLNKTYQELSKFLIELGYKGLPDAEKEHMLWRIRTARKRNTYLEYAAKNQAIIGLCVIFEDYTRRIIMKYYEEDIRRLSSKETVKSAYIVDIIVRKGNLHRCLAQSTVNGIMYGSLDDWCKFLTTHVKLEFYIPDEVKELFLVRHCAIHNNNRVSDSLHYAFTDKYEAGAIISLELADIKTFKDSLFSLALKIAGEFDRKYPDNKGTWVE